MPEVIVRYEPRGAARELFTAPDSEICIAGSAGTGKSVAALYKVFLTCLNVPNTRALIVRQTHASLTSTTLITFEHKVAAEALATGIVSWFGGSSRQPPAYRFSNKSTIVVGGLDRPEKFLSAELDLIFIDEATETTVTALETLISRLRGTSLKRKQIILACNPAHPGHWIKRRCDLGSMRMLVSKHSDNPAYVNLDGTYTDAGADYMSKLDALTGVRRLRLRDGIWAAAEGVIYEAFSDVHVIDPFVVPEHWTRWWVVDFGFTNPFCWQDWAEDGDGRIYLVREIYRTRRLVEDHARDILALVAPGGEWQEPRPRAVICDHDAEDRATLERHLGMSTSAATKTVSDGIQAVQARLKVQDDGKPRLFLVRGACADRDSELENSKRPTCTEEEFPGYIWAVKPGGDLKEEPRKEDDHGIDCVRYAVAELDLGPQPDVQWM
jgi:PBSX family phage terminase large subunit